MNLFFGFTLHLLCWALRARNGFKTATGSFDGGDRPRACCLQFDADFFRQLALANELYSAERVADKTSITQSCVINGFPAELLQLSRVNILCFRHMAGKAGELGELLHHWVLAAGKTRAGPRTSARALAFGAAAGSLTFAAGDAAAKPLAG